MPQSAVPKDHVSSPAAIHEPPAAENTPSLSPSERWNDALSRTKLHQVAVATTANSPESNAPKAKVKRAAFMAAQLAGPPSTEEAPERVLSLGDVLAKEPTMTQKMAAAKRFAFERPKGGVKPIKIKKKMEQQHWLELIDLKHRYGSNLQHYHEAWTRDKTTQSFQYWLDYGGGKDLSLAVCPREKLEQQQIHYLSAEERMHYKVVIQGGLFRWANPHPQNRNEPHPVVDTTPGRWIDSDGLGLYPRPQDEPVTLLPGKKKLHEDFIYVADGDYGLYIGKKQRGRLQHSSFLGGGPITSAGTLVVRDGMPVSFSPMSGHYRTKTKSFQNFIDHLKKEGVDLGRVHLTRTKLELWVVQRANTYHAIKKRLQLKSRDAKHAWEHRRDANPEQETA